MREDRLLESGDDDEGELEALGDVQGHHRDRPRSPVELIGVGDQCNRSTKSMSVSY